MLSLILDQFRATKRRHRAVRASFPSREEIVQASNPAGFIICFFTAGSLYETEARRMAWSAWRLGLNLATTVIQDAGSWVRNASLKPTFILGERQNRRGPLLYVDVDAVFHRDPWPPLMQFDCDIAVYQAHGRLLAGTILFNETEACLDLLKVWKAQCDANPEEWDQVLLKKILDEDASSAKPRYRVAALPVSFCWIFDRIINGKPDAVFIEHLQASRAAIVPEKRWRKTQKRRRRDDRITEIERVLKNDYPRS